MSDLSFFGSGIPHSEGLFFKFHPFACKFYGVILFNGVILHLLMCHLSFIYPSIEGHLGCFQFLAITNSAAMNIVEQTLLQYVWESLGYIPKRGIAGS